MQCTLCEVLDNLQVRFKTSGRNTNNLRYADDTTLMEESEKELKSLLMKVKEESKNAGVKLNIIKVKIMVSSLITSWQIEGERVEVAQIFSSWAPKSLWILTAAMKLNDTCSLKQSYDKIRQHVKKQRHHFVYKGLYSQIYGFFSRHVSM